MTTSLPVVNQPAKPSACTGCPKETAQCVTVGAWDAEARITFISESPTWPSVGVNFPGRGRNGILLRKLIKGLEDALGTKIKYNLVYAMGSHEGKPNNEILQHCSQLWQNQWNNNFSQQTGPHIIVPFGLPAAKSAGLMARKILDIRGRAVQRILGSRQVVVIPTFSLNTAYAKPGLANVMQQDMLRAVRLAYMDEKVETLSIDELAKIYKFPRTIEEVRALCDEIIAYYDPAKQPNPTTWPITVDTETNTLKPFRKDAKILMVSFGWDDKKACAILLDHPENKWYDPKEAWKEVRRVLECPKPKVLHNTKYDATFFEQVYGIKINNIVWDTLCGQHWISEDQKGVYGLKALTPSYCPQYEGYEDKLHDLLRHGEEVAPTEEDVVKEAKELAAAAGTIADSGWFEDGDVELEDEFEEEEDEEEPDVNAQWRVDPAFTPDTTEEQKGTYRKWRDAWFDADVKQDKKARAKALNKWKKFAIEIGLPPPTPYATRIITKKEELDGFAHVDLETLLPYAAADADVTRLVLKGQWRKINVQGCWNDAKSVMENLYIPASLVLGRMEFRGAKINIDLAREYDSQLSILLNDVTKRIYDLTCQEFNLNAARQLADVLQGMGFEVIKRTKTNLMSTSKDVIVSYQTKLVEKLNGTYQDEKEKHTDERRLELIESILLHRAAYKMKSSFLKRIREYSALDGHIHTTFHLTGTSTSRLSSSRLNLQNLPDYMCRITRPNLANPEEPLVVHEGFNVKALLIPESDDEVFWNVDISAAEIRVLCYYSGDPQLIKAVLDGLDIHTFFLTRMRNPKLDGEALQAKYEEYYKAIKVHKDQELTTARTRIKRVVFGILYGAGPHKIAAEIKGTLEAAQALINVLFELFPGIHKYISETKQEAGQLNSVKTVFGRYRRFLLAGVDKKMRSKAEREAVNFKIQSTSSDLVVSQLCEIEEHLHEICADLRLTVHDSMAGCIKKTHVKFLKDFFNKWLVERIKERFPWMPVPFLFDLEVGPSYGEKMKWSTWMKENPIYA